MANDFREDSGEFYPGGTVVPGVPVVPGGGSSVEVVAPSPDGAGKAADAEAVYEALEKKRDKTDLTVSYKEWGDVECSISSLNPYIETFRPKFENGAWTTSINGAGAWGVISVTGAGGDSADSVMVQLEHGIEGFTGSITYHRRSITTTLATLQDIPDALNDSQKAALDSGITAKKVEKLDGIDPSLYAKSAEVLPRYQFVDKTIVDGVVTVEPYTSVKTVPDGMPFTVAVSGDGTYMRDCVLRVECGSTAPTITWPANFHPRTDAETDFKCVAEERNVYWITEHSPNQFCVAGWQQTVGGGTSNGGAA